MKVIRTIIDECTRNKNDFGKVQALERISFYAEALRPCEQIRESHLLQHCFVFRPYHVTIASYLKI